jgi:hypothetical protein
LHLLGEVCWEDDVILDEQVSVGSWVLEKRHTLILDGLYEPGLRDAFAHKLDDVSVQVGQVMRESKKGLKNIKTRGRWGQGDEEREADSVFSLLLNGTHLVDSDRLLPVQAALLAPPTALLGTTADTKDDITRFPIGALVTLSLKHDLVSLRRAARYVERKLRRMLEDLVATTCGAQPRDDASPSAALVARHLGLREHTREDLLLHHAYAAAPTFGARVYVTVRRGARTAAVVAENALFDDELR